MRSNNILTCEFDKTICTVKKLFFIAYFDIIIN